MSAEFNPQTHNRHRLNGRRPARGIARMFIQPQPETPTDRSAVVPAILLAEDDDDMRAVIAKKLRNNGYAVIECRDGAELLGHLDGYLGHSIPHNDAERFDLIISDIRMPGVSGLSIVEGTQQRHTFPPLVLITAFADQETFKTANRCGVFAVLSKPFDVRHLLNLTQIAVSRISTKAA